MKTIIVGLEKIDSAWLDNKPDLELIVKRGIGVDSIDLTECQNRGIIVCNTPDAPSNAVAELTICQMINMLRKMQNVSEQVMRKEKWNRYIGRELQYCYVGIIGVGRIGKLVVDKLESLTKMKILINDIDSRKVWENILIQPRSLQDIYRECDIISIHIPLKDDFVNNKDFITRKHLDMMKPDVRLLNLSRGGIINEEDLYRWLKVNKKACVALDSYDNEAYEGKLCELGNVYLTPHLGSCTETSKRDMKEKAEEIEQMYINTGKVINRVV